MERNKYVGTRLVCIARRGHRGPHTDLRGYQWIDQTGLLRQLPGGGDLEAYLAGV